MPAVAEAAADGFEASQPRGAKECDAIKLVAWDRVNEEEKNKELACSLGTTNSKRSSLLAFYTRLNETPAKQQVRFYFICTEGS